MDKTAIHAGAPANVSRLVDPTAIQAKPPHRPIAEDSAAPRSAPKPLWQQVLAPLASLKLTVILFALSLVLIYFGTWAQKEQGIWTVVNEYFRSMIAWIPLQVLLHYSIEESPFSVPYPGGWLLGGLLFTNLLAAHALRFKMTWKRSGIFLLHGGILVMMLGEFITGVFAVERHMSIAVGESSNYLQEPRKPELAIVDITDPKWDDTVAIPQQVLHKGKVTHDQLPFDIELVDYYTNSDEIDFDPKVSNPATAGQGTERLVRELPEISGTDPNQNYDMPSAYITLKEKSNGGVLGTYLVSYLMLDQYVKVGDKTYNITLRPKRDYREYTVHLKKADYKVYPGTEIPKDYSSYVIVKNPKNGDERSVRIYMNNPMSYQGETFFQSSMQVKRPPIVTGLQVVRNPGKFLPYLACLLVSVGMLIHFGMHLYTFLQRRLAS